MQLPKTKVALEKYLRDEAEHFDEREFSKRNPTLDNPAYSLKWLQELRDLERELLTVFAKETNNNLDKILSIGGAIVPHIKHLIYNVKEV